MSGSFAIDFHGTRLRPWVRTSAHGPTLCYTTPLQCRNNICKRKTWFCCHYCSVTGFSAAFQRLPFLWDLKRDCKFFWIHSNLIIQHRWAILIQEKQLNVYKPTVLFVRIKHSPVHRHRSEELHAEKEEGSLPTIAVSRAGCHCSQRTMAPELVWNLQS